MEQMIIDLLVSKVPGALLGLTVLGSLVVLGQVVVALTPSPDDDAKLASVFTIPVLGPLLLLVSKFAPFQKKP